MRFSCKRVPVRFWVIALLALARFSFMSMTLGFQASWTMFTEEKITIRYWPFCKLSEEERQFKTDLKSFGIWFNITNPDCGPRYKWKGSHKAIIDNVQLFGQMVGSIPSGIFVSSVGYPLYLLIYCSIVLSILNALRGTFVALQWELLLVNEFFLGVHLGASYPAIGQWTARWAPTNERAIFEATHLGNAIGSTMMKKMSHYLGPHIGYRGLYYYNSGLTLILAILCFLVGGDDPETHRWISNEELHLIKLSQRQKVTRTKCYPPFKHILTSAAFWSLNILYFGMMVANMYFFSRVFYQFLYEFVGINKETLDLVNLLPYASCVFGNIISAGLDRFLRSRNITSEKIIGQIFTVVSHILSGVIIIIIGVAYCNVIYIIALITIGYACTGASVVSCYRNYLDIAPNFAGFMYGIMHFFGVTTRLIVPRFMNYVFMFNRGVLGWSIIFLLGGGCVAGTGIIYLFFGTTTCQWWNLKLADQFSVYKKRGSTEEESEDNPSQKSKGVQKDEADRAPESTSSKPSTKEVNTQSPPSTEKVPKRSFWGRAPESTSSKPSTKEVNTQSPPSTEKVPKRSFWGRS
ncbi:sialin-like isoform X2 [Anthonomus grandis grandis]|uniref:sialin-like isoform X2 n=1 Tax=Anthonomus grandis grandis TaxID=2921223 RepID=UPI002165702D|nr:sialin-like isoform X2 [Anthonomus grandis grandis]